MAITIATGVVNVIPDIDEGRARRAGRQAGDATGQAFVRGLDGRLRDSRGRFVTATADMGGALTGLIGPAGRVTASLGSMASAGGPAAASLGAVGGSIAAIAAASALPAIGAIGPILLGFAAAGTAAKLAFGGMGDAMAAAGGDAEKYKEELEKLGPEQQAMVKEVAKVKDEFKDFGKEIQKIVLPSFTQALKDARPALGIFKDAVRESAGMLAEFGKKAGELLKNNQFQSLLKQNFQIGAGFVREIGSALDDFAISWLEFGAASKPTVDAFARGMSGLLSQGLPGFFKGLETGVQGSADMFTGLFDAVNKILPALGELSGQMADTFGPVLGQIFARVGDLVRNVVDILKPVLAELSPLFDSVSEAMGATRGATDGLAKVIGKVLGAVVKVLIIPFKNLVDVITIAAPFVKNLASAIFTSLAPAFGKMDGSMGWATKLQNFVKENKLTFQQVFTAMADAVMQFVIFTVESIPTVFSVFRQLSIIALEVSGVLIVGMAKAFGWVPGLGDKLNNAAGAFTKFKDKTIENMNKAQGKIEDFSAKVTPRLEENRLKMNIKNWEAQIVTAKADLKTVPKSKRAALLATIKDLQKKVKDGKGALASVKDKTAKIKGKNQTGGAVTGAKRGLGSVKDRNARIKARNQTSSAVGAAKRALASIVSRTVSIVANFSLGGAVSAARKIFGFAGGGIIPGFAQGGAINMWPLGGRIKGPGSGTSDSILARVSNGEFIVRKRAVDFFGADFFNQLNSLSMTPARFQQDTSLSGGLPRRTGAMTQMPGVSGETAAATKVVYEFHPGSITLDASKLRNIQDLIDMIGTLRVTSRQFGARV